MIREVLDRERRGKVRGESWTLGLMLDGSLGVWEVGRTLNWQCGDDGRTRLFVDWNWRCCSRNGGALGPRNMFATRST